MYNLNITGSGGSGNLLSVTHGESSCTTPRTPEILNSLIAMTNPFDSYKGNNNGPRLASSPPSGSDINSDSSSGSPSSCMSPPSVQHTCSQLIKEGLKHTLQTKRRNHISSHQITHNEEIKFSKNDELTPEDEERRRRRRERNKVAATKCRLKKRERTVNLVQESEILENQNHDLKSQIQVLETQRRQLVDMLSIHRPTCTKQMSNTKLSSSSNSFSNIEHPGSTFHQMSSGSYARSNASSLETTSIYRRVNMSAATSSASSSSCTRSSGNSSIVGSSKMTYHRIEISSDYQRPSNSMTPKTTNISTPSSSYEDNTVSQVYNRPNMNSSTNYHHSYDDEEMKDDDSVWRSNSGTSIDTQFGRISTTDSGYSLTGQSITGIDSPIPYIPSEDGSPYSRPSSTGFNRPTCLDVSTSDYDSTVEIMDSPTVPPTYHNFDDSDNNYCASFLPDRGCIS